MYLLKKKGHQLILNIKRDSLHSFRMTNDAVISTEGRNLLRKESLSFPELLSRYFFFLPLAGLLMKAYPALKPTFPVYRKFYGGFIRKTRSESPKHAKILATKDFVPKPEGKSFKTAWIHNSTFFKEIPLVRPNVPSNQQKALCEPGTKYPTQIPKPRECRLKVPGKFVGRASA